MCIESVGVCEGESACAVYTSACPRAPQHPSSSVSLTVSFLRFRLAPECEGPAGTGPREAKPSGSLPRKLQPLLKEVGVQPCKPTPSCLGKTVITRAHVAGHKQLIFSKGQNEALPDILFIGE